jgi:hypothetical protein
MKSAGVQQGRAGTMRAQAMSRRSAVQVRAGGAREVTLLDYGAGNVRSVRNAIRKLGFTIKDVSGAIARVSAAPRQWEQAQAQAASAVAGSAAAGWARALRPRSAGRIAIAIAAGPASATRPRARPQVDTVADIAKADKLVFPGVGSFGQAMTALRGMGYIDALKDYIRVSARLCSRCLSRDAAQRHPPDAGTWISLAGLTPAVPAAPPAVGQALLRRLPGHAAAVRGQRGERRLRGPGHHPRPGHQV